MKHIRQCFTTVIGVVLSLTLLMAVVPGSDLRTQNRQALSRDLTNLALRAQDYYRRAMSDGGGGNSFTGLTADAAGMSKLTAKPITPNGLLVIRTAGTAVSIELCGFGVERGGDGNPITIRTLVFADSMFAMYTN